MGEGLVHANKIGNSIRNRGVCRMSSLLRVIHKREEEMGAETTSIELQTWGHTG